MISLLALVCVLTLLHYTGAQMRGPVLALYAAAHGATATGVGIIMGAHMAAAAIGSVPLGRAADVWGHRRLMLGGMVVSALASAATLADVGRRASVWAGWIAAVSGLLVQGVVFPFFPLLAQERNVGPAAIGFVFLVLGVANTAARVPAGWLIDRSGRPSLYAI